MAKRYQRDAQAKRVRDAAADLRSTVQEMLAPASISPTPQRLKLDMALEEVRRAVWAMDAEIERRAKARKMEG